MQGRRWGDDREIYVHIGESSQIYGSLIGRNSLIGKNSRLTNVIVGHNSVIPPGTTITDTTWENQ